MLVSVVMPMYNVENYLREALDSFVNQTLKDIEIICVDDGSTDSTTEIVREYMEKDSRISLLSQKNFGAGAARNLGLKHAQGKYLYFFDSDDYCVPQLLEKMVGKAEEARADITVLDYYRINEQTKEIVEYKGLDNRFYPRDKETFCYKDVPFKILSMVNPTPWNKLFNREFVLSTGLQFMTLSTTNDITFCALAVAMAGRIAYVNEPLMYYRINRKDSITSFKPKRLGNVLAAVNGVVEKAKELPYADEIDSAIMYFVIDNLVFALGNYAGNFRSKYFRNYYKELHRIFNSELFKNASQETIVNSYLYQRYLEIKNNSYESIFIHAVIDRIKIKLKKIAYPFMYVSVRRFEERIRFQNDEIAALRKQVNETTKLLRVMSTQLYNAEAMLSMMNNGLNTIERKPRLIVSMTSFPGRIGYVHLTLERLLNQTVRPDKVVLWLSEEQFPRKELDLPCRFENLKARGVEVKWCKGDIKAYKKLLPALKEYPDDIIITFDDDLVYKADLIETLYDGYRQNPKAIIASRAHRITRSENGGIAPYSEWVKEIDMTEGEAQEDLFFTGGAGTLFPPHIFGEEIFNLDIIEQKCPYADDIWLNIMAAVYNVKIICKGNNSRLQYIEGTQDNRLYDINFRKNDDQLNALRNHYKDKLLGGIYEL